jgi:hypothetical protein
VPYFVGGLWRLSNSPKHSAIPSDKHIYKVGLEILVSFSIKPCGLGFSFFLFVFTKDENEFCSWGKNGVSMASLENPLSLKLFPCGLGFFNSESYIYI